VETKPTHKPRLLVFNCHEAWVYQLGVLDYELDIIIGLKGRHTKGWDERMRPVPANARLISLSEARASKIPYYCIITHNLTDLMDVKCRPEPRIIVLHCSLEGRIEEEKPTVTAEQMREALHRYVELTGTHVVATSEFKGRSWGFTDDIVTFGLDSGEYLPYSGEKACGLRICNFIDRRRKILLWDFYEQTFATLPVKLIGHNPTMPGVKAAQNWDHLKSILRSHRFYIHTADPRFEAGYNMAAAEAMMAGMPVLGNLHPSSPIQHGISGFLSNDPAELREFARMLLEDRDLAISMGKEARKTAIKLFSIQKFKAGFQRSIEIARRKWRDKQALVSSTDRA